MNLWSLRNPLLQCALNFQCDADGDIQPSFESQRTVKGDEWVPVKPAVIPLIPPCEGKCSSLLHVLNFAINYDLLYL